MKGLLRAVALIAVTVVVLGLLFHTALLTALGEFLVKSGSPKKADIVVVLGGDGFGHRILEGGELVKAGWAPKALISGPDGSYGAYECDLAIPFAVKAGYPESYFLHFEHHGRSTEEEAEIIVPRLREMGVKRMILETSDYHTRRAGKIFHRAGPDLEIFVVAAPDEFFKPNTWWKNREGRKIFFYEWIKTIAEW